MSTLYDQQVIPYTGIGAVDRVGLTVEECCARIGRFGFVAKQLMLVQAAKMSSIANWEFKAALGRQLWEAALHWGSWRERISELRGHEHLIERQAEGPLNDFFRELLHSDNDAEFAVGLYDVILPAYQAALTRYQAATNPLVDQPTVRAVRHVLFDLDEQLAFGQSVLAAIRPTEQLALANWRDHLTSYLSAAGGVDGTGPTRPTFELPSPRHAAEFRIPGNFARDGRFTTTLPKANPYPEDTVTNALLAKMWVRAQEMTAAELCATVLFEWEDLPYEGYLDLARHCWDETRHSLFGQAALEGQGVPLPSVPNWVGYAGHTLPVYPQKRYSHLAIATEAAAMRHPGGKRGEWEWCKEKAHHPLMTTFQDFDWADEVNHVAYGRKWLIRYFCAGDRKRAEAMADETVAERVAYYQQVAELEKRG
ncbi:MAG: hypothetical protein KF832_07320 [Caldilineaceae bacterium]|nr:hypothetical protein [Caldilineaceae bacterium]